MAYDFTTAILRFRDLVTQPQDTIRLHRDAIAPKDFVWWGWWNKAGERIPDDAFRRLHEAAKSGLVLYLADSGTGQVYRARCTGVHWTNTGDRSESPDPDATPAYYREQRYFAWFRFARIDDEDPAVVTQFTYCRVDEFFHTGRSAFDRFYGKRVYSVEELRQQDRTIWFVRPATDADPTHEIALLNTRTLTPADFVTSYVDTPSKTLLWVSDPHFTSSGHHGFPRQSDPTRKTLARALEEACRSHRIETIAGVILSGDLSWRAEPDEYAFAREFITGLNSWARLDNYGYAICPGNHDLRFSNDPADNDQPVTVAAAEAAAAYAQFYRQLFYIPPNQYLSCGRRLLVGGVRPIEIVMLNSSLLQQRPKLFQGHGFVGQDQLDDAARRYGWDRDADEPPVRILVVHHHLVPVTYREIPAHGVPYSVALDAEAIMRWAIRCRVDVVLHGHMHQPFYCRVTRPEHIRATTEHTITIVGGGSAGVELSHVGEVQANTFATLGFSAGEMAITMYSVHPVNPSERLWSVVVPLHRH